jgi:hypothetical protein
MQGLWWGGFIKLSSLWEVVLGYYIVVMSVSAGFGMGSGLSLVSSGKKKGK